MQAECPHPAFPRERLPDHRSEATGQ